MPSSASSAPSAVNLRLRIGHAQLLSYLRLSNKPIGLLINFNVIKLTDGIKRLVHDYNPD